MLKVNHNAGFFSCCSIRLLFILDYFNENKKLPDIVDSSEQFKFYKNHFDSDITFLFFKDYNFIYEKIEYQKEVKLVSTPTDPQFSNYSKINFEQIHPFIVKYFSLSNDILNLKTTIENKYNIDYENTCLIRYRGQDKCKETIQPNFFELMEIAKSLSIKNDKLRFLILTDTPEFLKYAEQNLHHRMFYVEFPLSEILYFVTIICSIAPKCKYIIHTSGNSELFMMLYRGNTNGCYQYLNEKEYIYGAKNDAFRENKTNHWIFH
jgi:hypothetical protein